MYPHAVFALHRGSFFVRDASGLENQTLASANNILGTFPYSDFARRDTAKFVTRRFTRRRSPVFANFLKGAVMARLGHWDSKSNTRLIYLTRSHDVDVAREFGHTVTTGNHLAPYGIVPASADESISRMILDRINQRSDQLDCAAKRPDYQLPEQPRELDNYPSLVTPPRARRRNRGRDGSSRLVWAL